MFKKKRRRHPGQAEMFGLAVFAQHAYEDYLACLGQHRSALAAIEALRVCADQDDLIRCLRTAFDEEPLIAHSHSHFRLDWVGTAIDRSAQVVSVRAGIGNATARLLYAMVLGKAMGEARIAAARVFAPGPEAAASAAAVLIHALEEAISTAASRQPPGDMEARMLAEERQIASNLVDAFPALAEFPPTAQRLLLGRTGLVGEDWSEAVIDAASRG